MKWIFNNFNCDPLASMGHFFDRNKDNIVLNR